MDTCYIVGAGECPVLPFAPQKEDLVIAADGGYAVLQAAGIRIDLAMGDFDSLGHIPDSTETKVFPVRKDDTDMMLAIKTGLARGYRRFELYGGLGGQMEHSLANIQALHYLCAHGAQGFLTDGTATFTVLTGGRSFLPDASGSLSVFAFAGDAVITLRHLLYETDGVVFSPCFPLGVSNQFIGEPAEITVKTGMALVMWYGPPAWLQA